MWFHHTGERWVSWSFPTKLEFFGPSGSEDSAAAMDTWWQCVQLGFSPSVTINGWTESSEGGETKPGKHQQHLQSTEKGGWKFLCYVTKTGTGGTLNPRMLPIGKLEKYKTGLFIKLGFFWGGKFALFKGPVQLLILLLITPKVIKGAQPCPEWLKCLQIK